MLQATAVVLLAIYKHSAANSSALPATLEFSCCIEIQAVGLRYFVGGRCEKARLL